MTILLLHISSIDKDTYVMDTNPNGYVNGKYLLILEFTVRPYWNSILPTLSLKEEGYIQGSREYYINEFIIKWWFIYLILINTINYEEY
jgi:hypothetical protein